MAKSVEERWLGWGFRQSAEVAELCHLNSLFDSLMATTSLLVTSQSRGERIQTVNSFAVAIAFGVEETTLQRLLLGEKFDGYMNGEVTYDVDPGIITRVIGYQLWEEIQNGHGKHDTLQCLASNLFRVFSKAHLIGQDDESLAAIRGNLVAYSEYRAHIRSGGVEGVLTERI